MAEELILYEGGSLISENFIEFPVIMTTGGVSGPFTSLEIANMIDVWPGYLLYRSNEIIILLGGNVFVPFVRK